MSSYRANCLYILRINVIDINYKIILPLEKIYKIP